MRDPSQHPSETGHCCFSGENNVNKAVQEAVFYRDVNSFLQIFNILYPSLVKKLRYVIIKQKLRR
jgi:hypothetical protein